MPNDAPVKEDPSDNEVPAPRLDKAVKDKLLLIPDEPKEEPDFVVEVGAIFETPSDPKSVEFCVPLK